MKKVLAVALAVLMLFTVVPTAFASSDYDRGKVASNNAAAVSALTDEQIAGVILDWVDRQIADAAEGFAQFNDVLSLVDMSVPADLDGVIAYKDQLALLEGDFANLKTESLKGRTEAGSDLDFIYGVLAFMADNASVFGKVFAWEEGTTFDYGKVGEYITDPNNNVDPAIVNFYNDYLIGNNIQQKFVAEIAREMGYTIPEGEIFDEVLDNGIKGVVCDFLTGLGLLSDDGKKKVMDDEQFDLKTTDVYTLVQNLFNLVLSDNEATLKTAYVFLCDNIIRPLLKTAFGYRAVKTETAASQEVLTEFNAIYTDKELLSQLAGAGEIMFKAENGNYYAVNAEGTKGTQVDYGESFINFEAPSVEIWDAKQKVGGAYTPTNPDVTSYEPTVYSQYASYIPEETLADVNSFGIQVKAEELPEAIAALIASGDGVDMEDRFVMKINGKIMDIDLSETPIVITFEELEAFANQMINSELSTIEGLANTAINGGIGLANNTLSAMPAMALSMAGIPYPLTASVTVNNVSVSLAYKGYSDEDTFVCEVTALPTVDISYEGNAWALLENPMVSSFLQGISVPTEYGTFTLSQGSLDEIAANIIDQAVTNPVATIVVDNLNGTLEGVEDVFALMDYIDTDFTVDLSVLALDDYYTEYNGFVGQVNRVLCAVADMLFSDEGYEALGLDKGGNEYLSGNIDKICSLIGSLFDTVKAFLDENAFGAIAEQLNMDSLFASEHGFNASMLYNLDFKDKENLFACALKMGCDLLVKDEKGLLYDLHMIIEDLDTLEQMAVGVFNYALPKLTQKVNALLADFDLAVSFEATQNAGDIENNAQAKDYIMTKLVDIAYDLAVQAFPVVNKLINDAIAELAQKASISSVPTVSFALNVEKGATYEETLTRLFARFEELTTGFFREGVIEGDDVYAKISSVLNNFLPLGSMLSNAGVKGANGSIDVSYIMNVLFNECLDGDFDNFLRMFEVKEDALAGSDPVTYVLIKTSKWMVEPVFPGTVVPENTPAAVDCQQTFTGNDNDIVIAANNMKSINTYKVPLVSFGLSLIREAGILPFFAGCSNHTFGDPVTVEPTCKTPGSTTVTCTECGYSEITELSIDSTKHPAERIVPVKEVPATCTKPGTTAGKKCELCGVITEGSEPINANGHSLGDWSTEAASCLKDGKKTRSCANCDYVETEILKATGHSYGEWTVEKPATCGEDGTKTCICSGCKDVKTERIPATGNHTDENDDGICDACGTDLGKPQEKENFFTKIINFFKSIIDWFKNLFK